MTFDKQALDYAAFIAVEQVLDPEASEDAIVREVESLMDDRRRRRVRSETGASPGPIRHVRPLSPCLRDGVLAVYRRLHGEHPDSPEVDRIVRWARSHYGLN